MTAFYDPSPRAEQQRELIRVMYEDSDQIVTDAYDALVDQQPDWLTGLAVEWYVGTSAYETAIDDMEAGERAVRP